jgi:sulfur relay (sulfurtransferase) DsrF/TusC family protein
MEFNINYLLERKQEVEKLIIDNNESYINCLNSDYDKFYDKYIINEDNIEYILDDTFEEGIYGILIYQFDLKYDKILNSDNITFHNKQNIVKKLLNNNDLNDYAREQNYGILELYKIDENNIINLNKFFLLKNGNINHINNTSFDEINLDNLANDFIITKIYKIEDNNIIYKNSINKIHFINNVLKDYKFINYESLLNNIHNNRIIHHMSNFESIEMLKNINNNIYENDIFLLDDVLSFDFSNVIDKIKISNKYLKENYHFII